MFKYSLDNKPKITDPNGNEIVDLTKSIFARDAGLIQSYEIKRMSAHAVMRPDIVSLGEYGHTESAELILKYSGVSNPFTLDEDDILMIPNEQEADGQMLANNPDESAAVEAQARAAAIRNYFKFVNQDYKINDFSSYTKRENTEFKSAIPDGNTSGNYAVPYIADDRTAITIRNGRMFFGEDAMNNPTTAGKISSATTNLDQKIQALIDSTATALSDSNCLYNGVTLANFVKAQSQKNSAATTISSTVDDITNTYSSRMDNLTNS